jgi:putative nucleotidyltransferase with HDIG domain
MNETTAIKDKRVELVLSQLDELPTLPSVAMKVLEATSNDESGAREVVALIASDPALTTRILKLVHRADLGVRGEVNSVERAVVLLGFDAVRSAVLALSIFQTFAQQPTGGVGESAFTREAFWKHSIAVATCAELLARQLHGEWGKDGKVDLSEAFVCGLLHDLGKVALDAALPRSFAKVVEAVELLRGNIADVERQIVGIDHMVVGKRLAEKWKLPAAIRDCIWLHGQLPTALPATVAKPRLVNLITLADAIVREQHLGYSGNYSQSVPRQALLEAVGLSERKVSEITVALVESIGQRSEALGLGAASTTELYNQALAQANRELGRVSVQLAARNRKLVVRARFFDALSEFHGALRADAPPALILRAAAETAQEALGVQAVCAFSIPPGQSYAEVVTYRGEDDPETLVTECPARPGWDHAMGAVVPADAALEAIVAVVSPNLGGGRRVWTALLADGECVGGVLWGEPENHAEPDRYASMKTELSGLAGGWSLALRTSQIRDEARLLSEQLAEANRNLHDAQGQLLRAKTLGSIAEVAAGAAHEMNNPLAVICGRSQLLASVLTDDKHRRSAQLIVEQSERLSGMITELMEFARPSAPKPISSDVSEIIQLAIAKAKARPGLVDRTVDISVADVPQVLVDPALSADAVAEIVDNAWQATAGSAGASQAPVGHVTLAAAHEVLGGHVVLTITDDGCGMDEATLARAFDPFFSAKAAGRRRGMGLAKALRWVESFGGSIRLESRPGAGTRAVVLLPVAQPATGRGGTRGAASPTVPGTEGDLGSGAQQTGLEGSGSGGDRATKRRVAG